MVVGYQFVDNIGLGAMLGHVSPLDLARDGYQGNAPPPCGRSLGPGSTNQVALYQPAGTPQPRATTRVCPGSPQA